MLRLTEAVPFGIPGDAFVAHVLHAHGLAEMLRQHRGVCGGVALVVTAVGAGAEHPDRPHLFPWQAKQFGHALSRIMRLLRRGVERALAVAHVGDRAGRAGRRMRLRREFVFPFDDPHGLLDAFVEVAVLHLDLALDDRRLADVLVQLVVARELGASIPTTSP